MVRRFLLILMAGVAFAGSLSAQKVKDLEGEYTYIQPADESQVVAEQKAVKRAQTDAIAREFGTLVMSNSLTRVDNSSISHVQIGENEVKAEWIRDNKSPKFEYLMDPASGQRIIKVKVWFKAREIISKAVEVEANLLRNGTSLKNEDDRFYSGDQMYLHFKSPIDGYLVVYEMGEDNVVRRLLPYSRSRMTSYKIEGNKDYILFSPSHLYNGEQKNDVDEILFTASQSIEGDRICVMFSPNEIFRPADANGGNIEGGRFGIAAASLQLPRQLPFEKFQKWLSDTRLKDIQMRYVPIEIEIHKR